MVYLEGPDMLANAAAEANDITNAVLQAALDGEQNAGTAAANDMVDAYRTVHHQLYERINDFARLARSHLNSKG
ncbi:hypothetical protein [Streptomyces sp. Ru71]|uniref:hypothetical protein n=1 Tax=Streptomyces sp. Ru71 TaxID=2080746 RepID=UPI0015E30E5D|nr:hypothetical protein [Streptomyces sp. Ru71]